MLAAASAPVDPTVAVLIQYGAVGVLALAAMAAAKVLFSRMSSTLDQERQRGDRLEAELIKINETIRTSYADTIAKSAQATSEASRAVADALAAVRRG